VSKGYSIRVKIGGRTFGIISDEKPEYLAEVANEVDKSISELLQKDPDLTFERAAVLASLKFCDDAHKNVINNQTESSEQVNNLRSELMEYANELSEATKKNKELISQIESIKREYESKITELKMNFRTKELELRDQISKMRNNRNNR